MKKKIALLVAMVLCATQVFAYKYWEDHRTVAGNNTVHFRLCFPDSFTDNAYANSTLNYLMRGFMDFASDNRNCTINITEVHPNGTTIYRIYFVWDADYNFGMIQVLKGNTNMGNGTPIEKIYENFFYSYNTCYAEYERQCNKYLNML